MSYNPRKNFIDLDDTPSDFAANVDITAGKSVVAQSSGTGSATIDDNIGTSWVASSSTNEFIVINMDTSVACVKAMLRAPSTSLSDFQIRGSETGSFSGEEVTLFTGTRTAATGVAEYFTWSNTTAFRYYQLFVINTTGSAVEVQELELFETSVGLSPSVSSNGSSFEYSNVPTSLVGYTSSDSIESTNIKITPTDENYGEDILDSGLLSARFATSTGSGSNGTEIDNNTNTQWQNDFTSAPSPHFLRYQFSSPVSVDSVMIYFHSMKDFRIEGSNDFVTWTTLLTVLDDPNRSKKEPIYYNFTNSSSYSYYRIIMDQSSDTTFPQMLIHEVQFFKRTPIVGNEVLKTDTLGLTVGKKVQNLRDVVGAYTVQTGLSYTATQSDYTILGNNATNITITLPTSLSDGKIIVVKNVNATGSVVVQASSGNIDGLGSVVLGSTYDVKSFQLISGVWYVISNS